ncbi:MAG: XRE family transcriptional regulator [Rubrobacter sp.]|nr:XRE family transcriptional regulator [Rubrobacter sp.]
MINGERVKQGRELRGLTQTELAERIDKDQSTIAYIERGSLQPSDEVLEAIAIQTGFPPSFFRRESRSGFTSGSLQFRARKMSAGERTRVYQYARTVWESAEKMAEQINELPVRIPKLHEPPEIAADVTRSELGLPPDTPIPHVINAVERAGVLVLTVPLPLKKWDAFCLWAGEETKRPVIVIASEAPGDRLRYSVAHELGHLVLHRSLQGELKVIDQEANRFAGALLMPEAAMRQELVPPVSLTSLAELKVRWGVSIQALAGRARDLGIITERQHKYLFEQLAVRGWRKQEPSELAVPIEKPRAVRKMAELLYGNPIDYKRLAADVGFTTQFAKEIMALHADRKNMPSVAKQQTADSGKLLPFVARRKESS